MPQAPSTRKPVVPTEGWNKQPEQAPEQEYESLIDEQGNFAPKPKAVPTAAPLGLSTDMAKPAPQALAGASAAPAVETASFGYEPAKPFQVSAQAAPASLVGAPPTAPPALPQADPQFASDLGTMRGLLGAGEMRANRAQELTGSLTDKSQQAKPSLLRKIGGVAAGVGAGLLTANPLAGVGAYNLIAGAPERSRKSDINQQLLGLKQQDESEKSIMSGYNILTDAQTAEMGVRKDLSNQGVQERNSIRDAASARVTNAARVIEVTLGDGRIQNMQLNPDTLKHEAIGEPEPMKVGDRGVPVTPEMAEKYPDLKGVPEITQTTWTNLQQENRLGDNSKNEIDTAFKLWQKQNPDAPVENWFKLQPEKSVIERMGTENYIRAMSDLAFEQSKARSRATSGELSPDAPPEMSQALAHATARITSPIKKRSYVTMANQAIESGDQEELKAVIRQAALEGESPAVEKLVTGRMDTIAALREADKLLKDMAAVGVPTGLVAGGWENLIQSLGKTSNPKYIEFGSQAARLLNTYTNTVSGAAFSDQEALRYAKLFPTFSKEPPVNSALIKGMLDSMGLENKNYWVRKFGSEAVARSIGALDGPVATPGTGGLILPADIRSQILGGK